MINIVNEAINRKLAAMSFTNIITGKVESLEPLQIRINDRIVIGQSFIEPMSLGLNDYSPNSALPLVVGETIQMVRYNNGQRFYVLGKTVSASVVDYTQLQNLPKLVTVVEEPLDPCEEPIKDEVVLHKISKSGDYNDLVNRPIIGSKVQKKLYDFNGHGINLFNGRVSSINFDKTESEYGTKRFDLLTSAVTDLEDDPGDGFIETYYWDNSGKWDTQLYIPNGDTGKIKIRARGNQEEWLSWRTLIDSNGGTIDGGNLYLDGINSDFKSSTSKIVFGNSTTKYGYISANTSKQIWFSAGLNSADAIGYDGGSNSFRPTYSNGDATLGKSDVPWANLYTKGAKVDGILYIHGTAAGIQDSGGVIAFCQGSTNYAKIVGATNNGIYFNVCGATDSSKAMGYCGNDNSFRPTGDNDTAMLGSSAAPWNKAYITEMYGTADKVRGCYALNESSTYANTPWHKIASCKITGSYTDRYIVFLVTYGWQHGSCGILKARIRTNGTKIMETYSLQWLWKSDDIPTDAFKIIYTNVADTSTTAEIWWKCPSRYMGCMFTVLDEGDRQRRYKYWTLYNSNSGVAATTTGTASSNSAMDSINVKGTLAGNADTSTRSTKTDVTNTNPADGATYYPTFITGAGEGAIIRANNGIKYYSIEGTTSVVGRAQLQLGNTTASGTAGNKRGELRIFSEKTGCTRVHAIASQTNDRTIYLPDQNGTIQLKPTVLYDNSSGTYGTVTLSSSSANFNYLEIYYQLNDRTYAYNCTKVHAPNGKSVNLDVTWFSGTTYGVYVHTKTVKISGTSITKTHEGWEYIYNDRYTTASDQIRIVKVIGYV